MSESVIVSPPLPLVASFISLEFGGFFFFFLVCKFGGYVMLFFTGKLFSTFIFRIFLIFLMSIRKRK